MDTSHKRHKILLHVWKKQKGKKPRVLTDLWQDFIYILDINL